MTAREQQERKRQRLLKEAEQALCAVCQRKVTIEDRCQDGLYLHRHCAAATSTR